MFNNLSKPILLTERRTTEPNQVTARARFLAQICGALITFFGITALIGWVFDIPILKSISPNLVAIKFNTALAFLLSGIALWILSRPSVSGWPWFAGYLCALKIGRAHV